MRPKFPTSVLQTERSIASEFANTLVINGLTEKLLREGRSSYQSGDGGQAIAPEADFACFQAQKPLHSNVRGWVQMWMNPCKAGRPGEGRKLLQHRTNSRWLFGPACGRLPI